MSRRSLRSGLAALAVCLLASACVGEFEPIGGVEAPDEPDAAPAADTPDAGEGTPAPDAAPVATPDAGPGETLSVQLVTTPRGGPYAPRNVVAVWIESEAGAFQKTIGRWAAGRAEHLVAWAQRSGMDADAVSGATRPNHTGTLTVTWDLKDKAGQLVPDGTYTIRMELADANSTTTGQNHQGTFTFVKNGTAAKQTTQGGGFTSVVIDYSGR